MDPNMIALRFAFVAAFPFLLLGVNRLWRVITPHLPHTQAWKGKHQ